MNEVQIKDPQNILRECIGADKEIVDLKETPLVAPGENYGSLLLKADITLKAKNDEHEKLSVVAKLIPRSKELQEAFVVQSTMKKEINFYNVIVPALQSFQRECGVTEVLNFLPKYYGARLNLDEKTEIVDEDSVIILENLLESGFSTMDRFVGNNLDTAKLVLKDLAAFHAVPLAMKLKKPRDFDKFIKSNCSALQYPPPDESNMFDEPNPELVILEMLFECDKCLPYMTKISELLQRRKRPPPPFEAREPFATISHEDMWVNNHMIKFENGKPCKNVLIDFERYVYDSPVNDLIFFLLTSVENSVFVDHLDDLIKYYYKCFIGNLKDLGCEIDQFSWDNFQEEIRIMAPKKFSYALWFSCIVAFAKKGGSSTNPGKPDLKINSKNYSVKCKERFWHLVQECGKRNWI